MTSIAKLKDRARKHEQKEDWKAAIEAYQQVLDAEEGQDDAELELGLFNRVGDLYLRLGQTDDAVNYYEKAADKYAEAGFFNNAIALCNKALRHRPDRPQIYLKLSHLCAEQGFVVDARRWILDYAEREVRLGRVDAAFQGLEQFVEKTGDPDVRELLAQQLATHDRPDDAVEHFRLAYVAFSQRGESEAASRVAGQARAIDPGVELETAAAAEAEAGAAPDFEADGGVLPDLGVEEPPVAEPLADLETRPEATVPGDASDADAGDMTGFELSYSERGSEATPEDAGGEALGGLETFSTFDTDEAGALEPLSKEEAPAGAEDEAGDEVEALPLLDMGGEEDEAEAGEPLPLLDFGAAEAETGAEAAAEPVPDLGAAPPGAEAADVGAMDLDFGAFDLGMGPPASPGDADAHEAGTEELDVESVLTRARELVSRGLRGEALREMGVLSGSRVGPEVFGSALGIVNEILRHDADDIPALQRRVEYSARTGDRELLVDAYLDLAEALDRVGAETKAQAMYQRVLDLDPDNETARAALFGDVAPALEEAVDLDAILQEMGPDAAGAGAPGVAAGGGSDPAFAAMLSQFKARVTEPVETEDAGDHYDLGLAFKEMGLIDEAIGEFQTALTGGEERLKVYEELGQCYVQKGQYHVAIKIFNRALQVPRQDESELLGVYYHLGHCYEELGKRKEAKEAYARVIAIDPSFEDVPDRMARL